MEISQLWYDGNKETEEPESCSKGQKNKQRRLPVARVACNACHRSKRRCSATRPCSRCAARSLRCVYEPTGEQAQRLEALEGSNADLAATVERLKATHGQTNRAAILLDALQNRSDEDSALLLACLRVGDSWEQIVESFDLNEDQKLKLLAEMASSPNRKNEVFTSATTSRMPPQGVAWLSRNKSKANVHQGLPPWLDVVFGSTATPLLSNGPVERSSSAPTTSRDASSTPSERLTDHKHTPNVDSPNGDGWTRPT